MQGGSPPLHCSARSRCVVCLRAAAGSARRIGIFGPPIAYSPATPGHQASGRAAHDPPRGAVRQAQQLSLPAAATSARKHHPASCSKRRPPVQAARQASSHGAGHRRNGKRTGHHAKRHGSSTGKPADGDTCPGAEVQPDAGQHRSDPRRHPLPGQPGTGQPRREPLQPNAHLEQAAQGHTESMAFGDYFEHVGPSGDTPLSRMTATGYIYSSQVGYEVGENIGWGTLWLATPQRDRRRLDGLAGTPREHPRRPLPRHRDRRLPPRPVLARPRPGRRDLHAGLRRHRHRLIRRARSPAASPPPPGRCGPTPASPPADQYNLRSLTTTRRRNGYGSTRRQVGDRDGLGARHRTRHRGAARRAGRAGPDQRPRRRRRRAGGRRDRRARRRCSPAT